MSTNRPVYALTKFGDKTWWNQVGIAFPPNQDGSVTIQLNAVPLSGKLQIREKTEDATEGSNARRASR